MTLETHSKKIVGYVDGVGSTVVPGIIVAVFICVRRRDTILLFVFSQNFVLISAAVSVLFLFFPLGHDKLEAYSRLELK